MNVVLVSQCSKRALIESRRILDQFAERRGARTWQTPITDAGLVTLRKLLRKTARKNTAVACHWIRGRDHSELLWIVGNRRRFNAEGTVPTSTTRRNVLRAGDENDWHTLPAIRLLAQLAALLHDLGKASVAFQERLHGIRTTKNLYRHEWVSLRLFAAFVGDDDDRGWLTRLAGTGSADETVWLAQGRYQRDGLDATNKYPLKDLPPIAQAVGWLVVTHHRMPVIPVHDRDGKQCFLGKRSPNAWKAWLETPLARIAHDSNELDQRPPRNEAEPYWVMAGRMPVINARWRKQAGRVATGLLQLAQKDDTNWIGNPYVMHLARLSLMLSDHHYSGLGLDQKDKPEAERRRFVQEGEKVFANTLAPKVMKQSLLEHLLGVGHGAGLIAHGLPGFEQHLSRIHDHRGLRKRTINQRFAWQDKAFDAAVGMRAKAGKDGAFVVNMASTGCGKTLANARILYALADPQQGLRIAYALGLRTLTRQTGRAYRKDLGLDEDELAVHVGGTASRQLFEYYEDKAEQSGSPSMQDLIEEDSHVVFEGNEAAHPMLSRAVADPAIRKLLVAPMLVCTVDHLVPATEAQRAGRQIAPMLRLMSSDLVLDEVDDYGLEDMPALTRLVYWAGMLGTRVVLSSATLPPALITAMYMAYREGRLVYRRNRGEPAATTGTLEIPCLWVDEFDTQVGACQSGADFDTWHQQFTDQRATHLQDRSRPVQKGDLLPLDLADCKPAQLPGEFARHVQEACLRLHKAHAQPDPAGAARVSFGLVRIAHINPLFDTARALFAMDAPADVRIHVCVYHARFPQVQRSAIENMLDRCFDRRDPGAVFDLPDVRAAIERNPDQEHLFVVLASPVCEVGRDWDADWAIAEPSSMRSIIQLAGRVQRHRQEVPDEPNVLLFDTNLRHFRNKGEAKPAFLRPGYEKGGDQDKRFFLQTHWLHELLEEDEYRQITALPRIRSREPGQWRSRNRLVDLEQRRTACSMLPHGQIPEAPEDDASWVAIRCPHAALSWAAPQQQRFRKQTMKTTQLAFLPEEDETQLRLHRIEQDRTARFRNLHVPVDKEQRQDVTLDCGKGIDPWGEFDLLDLLQEQAEHTGLSLRHAAERFATVEVPEASRWRYHHLLGIAKGS